MNNLKERCKRALWLMMGLLLAVLLLLNAQSAGEASREALQMCGRLLIPSLFPFFVLSGYLNRMGLPGILGRLLAPLA